jgi:hypothetical protein
MIGWTKQTYPHLPTLDFDEDNYFSTPYNELESTLIKEESTAVFNPTSTIV